MPVRAAMMHVSAAAFVLAFGNGWASTSQVVTTDGLYVLEREGLRESCDTTMVEVEAKGTNVLGLRWSWPCSTQAMLKGWDIQRETAGM